MYGNRIIKPVNLLSKGKRNMRKIIEGVDMHEVTTIKPFYVTMKKQKYILRIQN
jgi:hypothetical protein